MTTNREKDHGSLRTRKTLSYRIVRLGPGWTMLIGAAAIVAQLSLGCSGDSTAEAPPPYPVERAASSPPPKADDTTEAESDEQTEETLQGIPLPPEDTAYAGTLTTTATVPFGGDGFCKYDITLRDVAIEIAVSTKGEITRATMRDLAVEKALDGCPYSAMEPSIQDFTSKTMSVTTTGTRVEFAGAKANRPQTALVVDLVPSANGYQATATWKRTDQTAPLAWSVTAKMALAKK